MKKFSIMALTIGAIALAVFKIFGKKSSCCKYSDDDFDDDFDDYDFETDCCADDELEVVIPAEENDETVEVKVEEKSEEAPEEEEAPAEEVIAMKLQQSFEDSMRLVSVYKGVPVPSLQFDSTGTKKITALMIFYQIY